MCQFSWQSPYWAEYSKHWPVKGNGFSWPQVVESTCNGKKIARYHSEMTCDEIESLEMSAWNAHGNLMTENGEPVARLIEERGNTRFYYLVVNRIIGASLGEETKFLKLQWSTCGAVHGCPITRAELIILLKRNNQPEFARFNQREEQQQ